MGQASSVRYEEGCEAKVNQEAPSWNTLHNSNNKATHANSGSNQLVRSNAPPSYTGSRASSQHPRDTDHVSIHRARDGGKFRSGFVPVIERCFFERSTFSDRPPHVPARFQ